MLAGEQSSRTLKLETSLLNFVYTMYIPCKQVKHKQLFKH